MSLLSTASRLNTANQLTEWNKQALASMGQAKQYFTQIATQLESMRDNPDYLPEDIAEVEAMKENIITEAKLLIPA